MTKSGKWISLLTSAALMFFSMTVTQAAEKTTLSNIEKNYHNAKILKVIHYHSRYVMIEYQYPGSANHFDLYDFATGARYNLPLGANYARLDRIISPNDIVFDGIGVNSEVAENTFPSIMKCTRKNTSSQFGLTEYPEYLNVNQGFTFNYGKHEELTTYDFTKDGMNVQFGRLKNDTGSFYADSTWIPSTHISYNRNKNQLTIQFTRTSIRGNFDVTNAPVGYIDSVHMDSAQGATKLVLQLKPGTQYYRANVSWNDSQHNVPELQISFLPENVTFKPGMIIFHEANGRQVDHFLNPLFTVLPSN